MPDNPFLDELITKAQQGDEYSRQVLIEQSKKYIGQVTSKSCKRLITWNDDEMSVSLIAFNEAIDRYDKSKNDNFYGYAKVLIHSRLVDYFRKEKRQQMTISFNDTPHDANDEGYEHHPAEIEQAWNQYYESELVQERFEEIQMYSARLEVYGISLDELDEASPVRTDARAALVQIANDFVKHAHLVDLFIKTRQLPLKQMLKFAKVSRKTIERGRKYIVALIIILISDDLPHLRSSIIFPDMERRVMP
jgi:RNA polymerase sigma factor